MRARHGLLMALLAVAPGVALATPPDASPRPVARASVGPEAVVVVATAPALPPATAAMAARPQARPPKAQRPAEIMQMAAPVAYLATTATVRPQPRPEHLRRLSQATTVASIAQPMTAASTGRKGAVCGDPEIRGTAIPPITARIKGCGLADGVRVTSVAGVTLSTPADIDCTTAKALKTWVKRGAVPAVGKRGGGLATLQVAASYVVRLEQLSTH